MNSIPLWAQIVIALLGSSIFGAIAGVVSSSIAARQKFRELNIAYRHKLNDNLLQNTRQYIDTLYIPINRSLCKLEDKYEDCKHFAKNYLALEARKKLGLRGSQPEDIEDENFVYGLITDARTEFLVACQGHIKLMDELVEQGKDVYLTIEFEEYLRSFNRFLYAAAKFTKSVLIVHPNEPNPLFTDPLLETPKFEERFFRDIRYLKSYIKEITLGTSEVRKDKPS